MCGSYVIVMKYYLIILFLGIQLFFLFNLQFTAWPEMLSYPYLRNNGFLIYKDMIHPYPPVLTVSLSWLYYVFGYHLWVMKAVAWGLSVASSVMVFLITRYLAKKDQVALLALLFYIMLQPNLQGNMLWFDNVIVFPVLLGLYFLMRQSLFLAGLSLSAAMLTKQTAALYLVFVIFYFVLKKTSWKQLKHVFIGPLVLGIPLLVRLVQENALGDFLNWTLLYPLTQFKNFPGYVHTELSRGEILVSVFLLVPLLFLLGKNKKLLSDKNFQILLLFLFVSILIIYPRFSFFHAQTALAVLLVSYGYLVKDWPFKRLILFSAPTILLSFIFIQKPVLASDWQKEVRFYGKADMELAGLISNKVRPEEKVYLLGLFSGLYAMSERFPPKRWTDNFGWYLEIPGVSEEILSRWEENPPKYIFWKTPSPGNWFDIGTYQPQKIVKWIQGNYNKKEEIKPGIWLWEKRPVLSD